MGLTLLTGLLFGLAPRCSRHAWISLPRSSRRAPARPGSGSAPWLRVSLSQALVVSQIAVSLLLLVAAGLFVRTLTKLNSVELGFNREHLLLFTVNARQAGYRDQALARFFDEPARAGWRPFPGVRAATASNFALVSQSVNSTGVTVPGYTGKDTGVSVLARGAVLLQHDADSGAARAGHRRARRRRRPRRSRWSTKCSPRPTSRGRTRSEGISRWARARTPSTSRFWAWRKNARYSSLKEELPPVAYLPYTYNPRSIGSLMFELRAAGDPMALASAAREIVRQADSRIPVTDMRTQEAVIDQTIGQERTFATLCTAFALLAVAIACVGLYGTMAYSVARRTNEIGLRMALGAERRRLIWMVLREVFAMAAVGLAIGLPVAFATTKFVKSFLFEMKPNDPWAIAGAAVMLVGAAVAAGYGPAWRASRIDPWNALRDE